jgi:hypothetical protein
VMAERVGDDLPRICVLFERMEDNVALRHGAS